METEFRRILEDPSEDELALALLRSAADDAPDPKSLLGAAAALGVGAAFASAAATSTNAFAAAGVGANTAALAAAPSAASALVTAAPVASAPVLVLLAKPLAIGLVTGLAAMGGLSYVADEAPAPTAPSAAAARSRNVSAPMNRGKGLDGAIPAPIGAPAEPPSDFVADQASSAEAPRKTAPVRSFPRTERAPTRALEAAPAVVTVPPLSQPTAAFTIEPRALPPAAGARVAKAPAPPSELTRQLAREVALLDRARAALGFRDAAGALRALAEYESERPSGNFDPEATVLRIRALSDAGDRSAAARLAKGFIAKYPDSRHVAWLRSIAR